jgi:hypothetical protein
MEALEPETEAELHTAAKQFCETKIRGFTGASAANSRNHLDAVDVAEACSGLVTGER